MTMKEGDFFFAVSFEIEKFGIFKFDFSLSKIFRSFQLVFEKEKIFIDVPFKQCGSAIKIS